MRVDWRTQHLGMISGEEVAYKLFAAARDKSRFRRLDFDLSLEDVYKHIESGVCDVTGIPFDMRRLIDRRNDIPFRPSLDRIDNVRGYVPDNIAVVAKIYNQAKWTWNDEDVFTMAKALVSRMEEKK